MTNEKRSLKVFICHAHDDKSKARELYRYLKRRGIQPWLDAEDLLPGQTWQIEIPKALETSDAIIICLSKGSVDKEGYVQKEIKFALDRALEMPEGRIFIIPARLDECDVPRSLSGYHWVDLFDEGGYDKLMKALKLRAVQLQRANVQTPKPDESKPDVTPKSEPEPFENKAQTDEHKKVRIFYDLAQHYQCEIPDSNAEIIAKNLLEELSRIKRIAEIPDSQNENRFTEYETNTIEYYDPKEDGTIQYALVIEGKKSNLVGIKNTGQFNPRSVESMTVIPEMLIITVSQGINNASRIRFDSNKLRGDAFVQFVKGILLELGLTYVPGNIQKPPRKWKTEYIIAIIGAAATVLAALIGLLPPLLKPALAPTATITTTMTLLPIPNPTLISIPTLSTKTSKPDVTPTKTITPTIIITETYTPVYTFEYFNDFNDLDGWIQNEGFFSPRCGKPVGQRDSKIFLPSNVAAGYLKLPNPIAIQENKKLIIETRYRHNDPGAMIIGLSPTNDYICRADWYYDGIYFDAMGGEYRVPSQVGLFLSKDHQRVDAVRVDLPMDDNWHIARMIRQLSTQEWSLFIDDEFMGSYPIVDDITSYKYLSFNAYGEGNLPAEFDYIKVYQE